MPQKEEPLWKSILKDISVIGTIPLIPAFIDSIYKHGLDGLYQAAKQGDRKDEKTE